MKRVIITGLIKDAKKRTYNTKDGSEKGYLTFTIHNQDRDRQTFINASCFNVGVLKNKADQLVKGDGFWAFVGELNSYKKQDDTWALGVNINEAELLTPQVEVGEAPQEKEDAIIWD